ncbi:MAG: O-antigen ligase family protein [Chlorobi bacterium]|nr:O-antigen ligase family protein [Chlorobiota bacterium]
MTEKSKLIWVYMISALYIAFNTVLFVNNFYWGALLPLVLFIALVYFISLDKILLLITFVTPLAINVRDLDMGFGISLPSEPLMVGVLIFFLIKVIYDYSYDFRILKHPVTLAIFANLIWLLFTSITSEMPIVSFKFIASRLWFIVPFYFVAILLFKKFTNIKLFLWLYIIPFAGVILYTIFNHSLRGFDEESSHWVMTPFYNDHTVYGAILAMYIPVLMGFSFHRDYKAGTKIIARVFLALFVLGVILSYGRAAWISLVAALGVYIVILLKIKFRWLLLGVVVFFGLFFAFQQQILESLERNKQDSSANFVEHVQSISNISSDASNLERINRWQSAIRMFDERPFWGWGPGTYQFLYAPYQRSKEKTIISTNAGDMGNAHSEYIGPLAESGVLGMITIIVIFVLIIITGIKVYRKSQKKEVKMLAMISLLGLITYFIHGFLNNFLDTDKASVPVWGFMAIIVALDIYYLDDGQTKEN